ncbi:MAG: AglZ/HisF2 family acetamidino modification protein [Bacteroidota bacterium]|jgi:cyclase
MKTRVIPVLLLKDKGLVKTTKFAEPRYIGDPINSVRIFNEKEVDELAFLDISATPNGRGPDFETIEAIAGEAFMPMAYGGGLTTIEQVRRVMSLGFEKVIFSTATYDSPAVVREAVRIYGAQSVVACIDVKRKLFGGYELSTHSAKRRRAVGLSEHVANLVSYGVGEIIVNSIDRDGTQSGYDLAAIKAVSSAVSVPVIACGGAGSVADMAAAVGEGGASAVAAGSLFVYKGKHRAVLINYPERAELRRALP